MTDSVTVAPATKVDDELMDAFARLVPQLSRSAPPPGRHELESILSDPGNIVLVARDGDGAIVGTLTLVLFRIPTGMRAWIEDVVVDETRRRTGAGRALTAEAVRLAAEAGARTVDLTSTPARQAANQLYLRMGFKARETNVYRYEL